jgi:predicted Na+-dependent transporter
MADTATPWRPTQAMQAHGNAALALMLCAISNLLGIVTVPFFLKAVISSASSVSLNAVSLLVNLVLTIAFPLVLGKLIQSFVPCVKELATKNKVILGLISNGSLVVITWQTISRAQVRALGCCMLSWWLVTTSVRCVMDCLRLACHCSIRLTAFLNKDHCNPSA